MNKSYAGTHETIKKCCAAVLPKKRKRHMETKHMPNFWSRYSRRRYFCGNRKLNRSSSSSTIYIDLETDARMQYSENDDDDEPMEREEDYSGKLNINLAVKFS